MVPIVVGRIRPPSAALIGRLGQPPELRNLSFNPNSEIALEDDDLGELSREFCALTICAGDAASRVGCSMTPALAPAGFSVLLSVHHR